MAITQEQHQCTDKYTYNTSSYKKIEGSVEIASRYHF